MTEYGTTLALNDRMTPILNNIIKALNMTVGCVHDLHSSIDKDFDTGSLSAVNAILSETSVRLENMGGEIDKAAGKQRNFNRELSQAYSPADQLGKKIK